MLRAVMLVGFMLLTPLCKAEVPYYSQLDNLQKPASSCSITSLAMVTDYFGLTDPEQLAQRTPDYLFQRFGLLQQVADLAEGFNTLAKEAGSNLRDLALTRGTIAQLQEQARSGQPTIVHGWFTPPGHILVVTGYDGEYYTVHDPYGQWDLQKWGNYDTGVSGRSIRYPKAAFEYAINDNGSGDDLWLHIFLPEAVPTTPQ